jgi:spore coat protein CotH
LIEEIKKIIDKEVEKIKKEIEKTMEYQLLYAEDKLKNIAENIKKTIEIETIKINPIDIILKGGIIKVAETKVMHVDSPVELLIDHYRVIPTDVYGLKINEGKYRVVLILEPLEEEKKE